MPVAYRDGFSLIELVVVLLILGVVAVVLVPNFMGPGENQAREFSVRLNELTQVAWQNALLSHNVQRVMFDFNKRVVSAGELTKKSDRPSQDVFTPIKIVHVRTRLEIPEKIVFKNFFIDGKDELAGEKKRDAWFFIMPDGTAQSVVMNFVRRSDNEADEQVGLVLNPLNAQFSLYATFQHP